MSLLDALPWQCPSCGAAFAKRVIPCPDGREGCLVLHFSAFCDPCELRACDAAALGVA